MIRHFIFFLIAISFFSCQAKQKFDKVKWAEVGDLMTFPNRKLMIDDLTNNFELKGKRLKEITDLLGQPQGKADRDLEIFYDVDVDYGNDIDPVYTKTLIFHFDKDSVVAVFEVKEWEK